MIVSNYIGKGGVLMKRWIVIVTIILIGLLSACSSEMNPNFEPTNISFNEDLFFSWNTMTFTDLTEYDILDQVGTPTEDYFIAYNNSGSNDLSENQLNAYRSTIALIVLLDQTTDFDIANLIEYSSAEFAEYLTEEDLSFSAIELLTFTALQDQMEHRTLRYVSLTKRDYIENRLERALTEEEVDALHDLQQLYAELKASHSTNYQITQDTFQQFLEALEGALNITLTVDEQANLEVAFDIIQELT